jgi:hypothetical protein
MSGPGIGLDEVGGPAIHVPTATPNACREVAAPASARP